jgi:hypothetical protein
VRCGAHAGDGVDLQWSRQSRLLTEALSYCEIYRLHQLKGFARHVVMLLSPMGPILDAYRTSLANVLERTVHIHRLIDRNNHKSQTYSEPGERGGFYAFTWCNAIQANEFYRYTYLPWKHLLTPLLVGQRLVNERKNSYHALLSRSKALRHAIDAILLGAYYLTQAQKATVWWYSTINHPGPD